MRGLLVAVLCGSLGCGPSTPGSETSEATSSGESTDASGSSATPAVTSSSPGDSSSGATPSTTASVDGGSSSTGSDPSGTTGAPVCTPTCQYLVECIDGLDNDGDGLIDQDDPECLAPCHDGEESTHHGVPADGGDCNRDCYFDDNHGQGDDTCIQYLRCDPLGPGELVGCPADPDHPSCNQPIPQRECASNCLPLTPPGCDCYGCCTIPTPRGPEDRWMEGSMCTLDDPDACPLCTQNLDCLNPCDDPCEWCIGMTELPPGCEQAHCDYGTPCTDHCDCADGLACMLGCCRPGMIPI